LLSGINKHIGQSNVPVDVIPEIQVVVLSGPHAIGNHPYYLIGSLMSLAARFQGDSDVQLSLEYKIYP
jgi:hypothetical protein